MVVRLIKLITVFISILLITSCARLADVILKPVFFSTPTVSIVNATYDKNFFIFKYESPNYDVNSSPYIPMLRGEVSNMSNKYSQIQTSFLVTTLFDTKVVPKNRPFVEKFFLPDLPNYKVNITIFDEPQKVDNDVVCPDLKEFGADFLWQTYIGVYLLKDALNYQVYNGYAIFLDKYNQTNNKRINNTDIQYKINADIFTDLADIGNNTKKQIRNVIFHYRYNIDVFNNKTKKVYLSKKLQYDDNTTITTDSISYYKYTDYIALLVRKNRAVLDSEVFTDELYNTLTNTSQNPPLTNTPHNTK